MSFANGASTLVASPLTIVHASSVMLKNVTGASSTSTVNTTMHTSSTKIAYKRRNFNKKCMYSFTWFTHAPYFQHQSRHGAASTICGESGASIQYSSVPRRCRLSPHICRVFELLWAIWSSDCGNVDRLRVADFVLYGQLEHGLVQHMCCRACEQLQR